MAIVDNTDLFTVIETGLDSIKKKREEPMIIEPFTKDFSIRFCWSSNAIEGNTLDLDETVSVLEYDEVRGGHTYTEYEETKNLYRAINELLIPFRQQKITESWLKDANGMILRMKSDYRRGAVYVGTLAEAVYYPPAPVQVPALMESFLKETGFKEESISATIERIAVQHIQFEQIHPFQDGNGRVGRMILNQQFINAGLLPIIIEPKGKYRQAFRQYQKNKDASLMTHILCKGETEAIERVQLLAKKQAKQVKEWSPKL